MRYAIFLLTLPQIVLGSCKRRAIQAATPNRATVKNSCTYEVYLITTGPGGAKPMVTIPPGANHSEDIYISKPGEGGISFKVLKSPKTPDVPMQFEYTATNGDIWYNLSLIDCVKKKDKGGCAGHDGGLRAVAGRGCRIFQCGPNTANPACDIEGYTEPEFGYKDGAPVSKCSVAEGVTFELCSRYG